MTLSRYERDLLGFPLALTFPDLLCVMSLPISKGSNCFARFYRLNAITHSATIVHLNTRLDSIEKMTLRPFKNR